MIWFVKHHRRDQPVEAIRCYDLQKARRMSLDLEDVGEIAWVENERGIKLQSWDFREP